MIKKRLIILMMLLSLTSLSAADIYFNASADVYTRYIHRGFTPAGNRAVIGLNVSAFFSDINLNLSQWYVNSLSDVSTYHELGTMASYYHYFNDRLIGSAGLTLYLYPILSQSPLASVEAGLTLTDVGFIVPYFIETYFDLVLKSWYTKFTAGYTIDTFIPLNLTLSGAINLLSYQRYGIDVPAGLSDIGLHLSTFISLKKWQISPKLSCIFPNRSIYPKTMLQASMNLAYSF